MASLPVSAEQNLWSDGQAVDNDNLSLEQNYNNTVQSAIIDKQFGTGVLSESLVQSIFFDTLLVPGLLDGKALDPIAQPSDAEEGNQLEIVLTNSLVASNRTIKVLILGLDFENNLQYDRLIFHTNESQFTQKHYTRILKIYLNDFLGESNISFNLGAAGRLQIKQAKPFSLNRDGIMLAQDVEPNLFFRDFFTNSTTLLSSLQTALPQYNISSLNIKTAPLKLRSLVENDTTSHIGQKFQATTSNIQKITLLLSVTNPSNTSDLQWTGNIVANIYPLQSSVSCFNDLVPELAIDYPPSNIPIAQVSFTYQSLKDAGIVLSNTPQPVDFVFSSTQVASLAISKDAYYAVTLQRANAANKCQIQLAVGSDSVDNSMLTTFNGSTWVDIPEEDLWFQIWTDAAKVSDGQAYATGKGITIPKTKLDATTGITSDYSFNQIEFKNSNAWYAYVQAITEESTPIQNQRTGNAIFSRQQFVPAISLIDSNQLSTITASQPFLLGTVIDKNIKSIDSSTQNIESSFHSATLAKNEIVLKVIDDSTNPRYDTSILDLVTEINAGSLINAKFYPNKNNINNYYRVARAEIITMITGDINGDGVVDEADLALMQNLIGVDLNSFSTSTNYQSVTNDFKAATGLTLQLFDPDTLTVVATATDLILTPNTQNITVANINTASINFSSITNLTSLQAIISTSSFAGNNGTFKITGLVNANTIVIQKFAISGDLFLKYLRADVSDNLTITTQDFNYLQDYVYKANPFPATTLPASRIGTTFRAIKLTLEKYEDRADDYFVSTPSTRASTLHPLPDVVLNDTTTFLNHDYLASPVDFLVTKQLTWNDYEIGITPNPKLTTSIFPTQSGYTLPSCTLPAIEKEVQPIPTEFDPGRNDFFLPNDLILNFGGNIKQPDGYLYQIDHEIHTINLEMPALDFTTERTINIFTDFIADYSGTGYTRLGYQAARFADCTFVPTTALQDNQVRFNVSVQSFSPNITDPDGAIVDGRIGVNIDYTTGLTTFLFNNLIEDPLLQTRTTKIQITAYLKKASFNNQPLILNSTITKNLFNL